MSKYRLKFKDIEYIIPHEQECRAEDVCKPYTEERMIELCHSVDKPLTFAEKFEEVFGYKPDTYANSLCSMMDCHRCDSDCSKCSYTKNDWDEPYVKTEVEDDKC